MRIGILTFHMSMNYGAFWQAYALNKYIDETLDAECFLINYESKYTFYIDIIKRIFQVNILKGIYSIFSILAFRKGWSRMKKTAFCFQIDDSIAKEFDAIILGSDEIWNYKNPFVDQNDYSYFGSAFNKNRIITFSPSFGTVNSDEMHSNEVTRYIKRIRPSNISVRDENSQRIVEKFINTKVPILIDPVFLYDVPDDKKCIKEKYILIYGKGFSEDIVKAIKKMAQKEGCRIYSFGFINTFVDRNIIFKSPLEIVKYFKCAQYIFTNMYHGVVFSLHYKKQFWMQYNKTKENKVATLLNRLEMKDRIIKNGEELIQSFNYYESNSHMFEEKLEALKPLIEESKDFIKQRVEALRFQMIGK